MLVCQAALTICFLLLFWVSMAQALALRSGRKEQAHVLRFFRLGLGLSACSYAVHLLAAPPNGIAAFFSFFCCLAGTALIWRGWNEQRKLHQAHSPLPVTALKPEEEQTSGVNAGLSLEALFVSVPPANPSALSSHVELVLHHAQGEARGRQQSCVDTDHLLLGLLEEPDCAGVGALEGLGISRDQIHKGLTEVRHNAQTMPLSQPLRLTPRAREVLKMAASEAHRFGKAFIGTDHLLLGLLLIGTGPAATTLFREGVTVDRLRQEIIKKK